MTRECLFWDCYQSIKTENTYCYNHYQDFVDGNINKCPECGHGKYQQYDVCLECYGTDDETAECFFFDCPFPTSSPTAALCPEHYEESATIDACPDCGLGKYKEYQQCLNCHFENRRAPGEYDLESSPQWAKGDADAPEFYVYILKFPDGNFYVGQTRDLRARLSEHRDNKTKSTAGRGGELVWFIAVETRERAVVLEAELKRLNDRNQRLIRQIVIDFEDKVRELAVYRNKD